MTPEPATWSRPSPDRRSAVGALPDLPRGSRRGPRSSPSSTSRERRRRSCCTATPTISFRIGGRRGHRDYGVLAEFLAEQLFGRWSLVLHYDLGRGLRAFAGPRREAAEGDGRARQPEGRRSERAAEGSGAPRSRCSIGSSATTSWRRTTIASASRSSWTRRRTSFPPGEPGRLNLQASSQLVTMLNWAMSPHVKRLNMAFVLVDEKLPTSASGSPATRTSRRSRCRCRTRPERERVRHSDDRGRAALAGLLGLRRRGAGQAHRRHLADRSQRADPVGARERPAARRAGVPRAEEAADRAAVPRPARVHRAEVDARHRRRPRGGQGAAARGRGAAQARRARQPADGLSALRPGRHRQVVSRAVRQRRDRRALRDAQELPVEVRRRDGGQPRARARRCCARWARWSSSSTRPTPRSAAASQDGDSGTSSRVFGDDRRADGRHAVSRAASSGCC